MNSTKFHSYLRWSKSGQISDSLYCRRHDREIVVSLGESEPGTECSDDIVSSHCAVN